MQSAGMLKLLSFLPTGLTKRIVQSAVLIRNPYILGVRVIVEDASKQVLLVRQELGAKVERLNARIRELSAKSGAAPASCWSTSTTNPNGASCRPRSIASWFMRWKFTSRSCE